MRRKIVTYRRLLPLTDALVSATQASWLKARTMCVLALLLCLVVCAFHSAAADHETLWNVSLTSALGNGEFAPSYVMNNRNGVLTQSSGVLARAGVEYSLNLSSHFSIAAGADVVGGAQSSTDYGLYNRVSASIEPRNAKEAPVWLQQLYARAQFRNVFFTLGMRERESVLVNQRLSSGDLCFSGNIRPMPGVTAGFADFCNIPLTGGWVQICGEVGYFKALDKKWKENRYNFEDQFITTGYTYNYKYLHLRTNPSKPFSLTIGMQAACQIGGTYRSYKDGDMKKEVHEKAGLKQLIKAFFPGSGGSAGGDQVYYEGNHVGTWDVMGRLQLRSGDELKLYYQSPWEDGSGIGKLNGFDGLYGVEYVAARRGIVDGAVLEYIDLMNQSGPMHWAPGDFEGTPILGQATGADDYYNNYFYDGYQYYGLAIGSPLVRTAIYNTDGYLRITDNRLRGFHTAVTGHFTPDVQYWVKCGYRRSVGTPFVPLKEPRSTTSISLEARYDFGDKLSGLSVHGQVAGDFGKLLGDNFGVMVKFIYNGRF